jgi:hypothetical protein
MVSIQEVLQIAIRAKEVIAAKKGYRQPQRRSISQETEGHKNITSKNLWSDSKSNCFVVADRKMTYVIGDGKLMVRLPRYFAKPWITLCLGIDRK